MNKERFTELLNLYLDDEISSADLSDLMRETRRDPDRQKMFLDYCRIHKACSLLGDPFESRRNQRTFKQIAYAIGGLAAAFALLGMAGRNLWPMLNGTSDQPSIVQNGTAGGNTLFFPEIASSEVATPRFFKVNGQPQGEYVGVSNFGNVEGEDLTHWNDRLVLNASAEKYGLKAETLFSEDLLDFGALDLQDPFNAFDEAGGAAPLSVSKAAFSPGAGFEVTTARNSRLNLK